MTHAKARIEEHNEDWEAGTKVKRQLGFLTLVSCNSDVGMDVVVIITKWRDVGKQFIDSEI